VVPPAPGAPLRNALEGRSHGFEVLLQRRSANGLSGLLAYTYGHATRRDDTGTQFDSDFDQRHTVTAFASMRLGETWNVSAKYRYGSSFPIAGYFEGDPDGLVLLSDERNALRPGAYSRLDLRANKAWLFRGWKLTLFGELGNVFDHENARYSFDGLDTRSRRVFLDRETLFPFVPAIGVTADF
jgi:hypothetical protein